MLLSVRRVVVGAIGAGAVAGAMLSAAAPALADPPPNSTAADLAGVSAGVSAATSAYLFTHPDVNYFFTDLAGTPREQVQQQVTDYLDGNPQAKADLTGIRQPLVDIKNRCGDKDGDGVSDIG